MTGDSTRAQVARRLTAGHRVSDIADELELAKATVGFHAARLGATHSGAYAGRRAVVEILARSGVRASELCDLRIRNVRLHDPDGARFQIRDSKTDTGVREVQMTPDRLQRAGQPTGPDGYVVPNLRGGRVSRQRVAKIVTAAATLADKTITERGIPPLPNVTPHSLTRTYISIALLANSFDVKWVMSQVGHADSKMTLDVYAQLEQRVQRDHGRSLDLLISRARITDAQLPGAMGQRQPSKASTEG